MNSRNGDRRLSVGHVKPFVENANGKTSAGEEAAGKGGDTARPRQNGGRQSPRLPYCERFDQRQSVVEGQRRMGRSLAAMQQWPLLKNNTTNCRSGGQHGQLRKWCVPTASRPPQDKCILMAPCLRGWHRSTSKANATSGWPQRVAPACGVIGNSSSRKNNSIRIQPGSQQDQRLTWCVPQDYRIRNSATFAERMCPHTPRNGVSPRTRCVPTALGPLGWEGLPHVKDECRQWVAPASSLGMPSASVICRFGKTTTLASGMQPPYRIVVEVVCPHGQRD